MSRVIVVGGGLSGLSAAHTIYQRGGNVLVLDKNGFFGGNSTKATSGINGAGTIYQAEQGIPDSAKIFFEDTKKSAGDLARDDLIKVLTGRSGEAVNWLHDTFGLELNKISRLGAHSEPRTHRGNAQFPGMSITYAEMEKLEDLAEADPERIQILRKAKVVGLVYEENVVKGVEYEFQGQKHKEFGPVVLATGGYAADFEDVNSLLKKHRPDIIHLSTTNGDHCTGDGHKMVAAIGGSLIDLEKVQVHPTGLVDPKDPKAKVKFLAAEALRGCGGLLLDNEGHRFVDELQKRDWVSNAMFKHDKFPVRLVLNGKASREIEWHCKHYAGRGLMKKFESGQDLAKEIGCSADTLKATFDKYNKIANGEEKDPFGKKYFSNGPFTLDDYFYVAQMEPVLHYTMGGLEINDQSEVLDTNQKVIPGLFACGEIAGGVHGANRLGGSSLLGCVVFGRVAGDTSSAYLFRGMSTGKIAAGRANQVANHLSTTVNVNPENKNFTLTFSWDGQGQTQQTQTPAADSAPPTQTSTAATGSQPSGKPKKKDVEEAAAAQEYTMEEVAKHTQEGDRWLVVDGKVLKIDDFLPDHPGGVKAILPFIGKDATEGFLQFHEPTVIAKYAPEIVIGRVKQ
ncbi:unnamed protein product [Sympodiomycopsis kandeliae]